MLKNKFPGSLTISLQFTHNYWQSDKIILSIVCFFCVTLIAGKYNIRPV